MLDPDGLRARHAAEHRARFMQRENREHGDHFTPAQVFNAACDYADLAMRDYEAARPVPKGDRHRVGEADEATRFERL